MAVLRKRALTRKDANLKAYVMTLQKFEKLLKQGIEDGSVTITESTIETDNIFEL